MLIVLLFDVGWIGISLFRIRVLIVSLFDIGEDGVSLFRIRVLIVSLFDIKVKCIIISYWSVNCIVV